MPTKIITKNGSGAPDAADLDQGELAVDLTNKRLYTEDSGGSVIEVGSNPSALSIAGTAVTATATELNVLDGITSTTAELNILDGVTSTASELNVLDGITATTTELNYTDGVTSNIQTQLNAKAPIDAATFTGTTTIPTADINGGAIDATTIGGSTPAAGSFTTITGSGDMNIDSGTLFVDASADAVGIGNTDPSAGQLVLTKSSDGGFGGSLVLENSNASDTDKVVIAMRPNGSATTAVGSFGENRIISEYDSGSTNGASNLQFWTHQGVGTVSERMRIDSSGRVGIGDVPKASFASHSILQVGGQAILGANDTLSSTGQTYLSHNLYYDLSGTPQVFNTSNANEGAIYAQVDGNHIWSNSAATTGTPTVTERMRIDASSGHVLVGKTAPSFSTAGAALYPNGEVNFVASNLAPVFINRLTNDGNLVQFYQDTSLEGSISVSGSTVSYNGGHLSRWSRLADDSKDTLIVKGTVMTNLDEMVVWSHEAVEAQDAVYETVVIPAEYDEEGNEITPETTEERLVSEAVEAKEAYTEDNEQLNKMAVSSVEGDPNVAGVFVSWDEEDDFNDMNIAMTGDMVIRIAEGTTVARGDLLMSAGDGTAKPQGDDIVRSKTIAKVTSTHVSHTYDDGSYLVPCVLMAC